jgi:hypothetical protein
MGKKQTTDKSRQIRVRRNNNPFAIIQPVPDNWKGLTGKENDGFLQFSAPIWGVRAGYINLINGYIRKGLNTISAIFPVYAPDSAGNNSTAYISRVSQITGIDPNRTLNPLDIYAIGISIQRIEGDGKTWVDPEEWDRGFTLAIPVIKSAFPLFDFQKGIQSLKTKIQKATAVAGSVPL